MMSVASCYPVGVTDVSFSVNMAGVLTYVASQ